MDGSLEIRCFCNRRPLLARCGRDLNSGEPFVHIKTWKKDRLYVEVVVTQGIARIRCRECMRWHTVRIVRDRMKITQEKLPDSIALSVN